MQTYKLEDFEDLQELIEALQGTCYSLDTDGLTEDQLGQIDDQIFLCAECGWWCEAGDYNQEACEATGEDFCSECGY